MSAQRGYAYPEDLEYRRPREREQRVPSKKVAQNKARNALTGKGKRRALTLLILGGILALSLIVITAYGASIKYEINATIEATATIRTKIENLEVKIERGRNINTIEDKALNELGLVYPAANQFVYITGDEPGVQDFAQIIKENAYQVW